MPEASKGVIDILIVDDHPVVRTGLKSMFESYNDFVIVAAVSSGEEALTIAGQSHVAVVLLDLRMPGMSGFDTLRALKKLSPGIRVAVLTSFELDEDIYQAMHSGADGYILKNTADQEIVQAIRAVHAGKRHIPQRIAAKLAERMLRSSLTPRELEILELLAKGLTNKQIGGALRISGYTVRNHVDSILDKLDVSDRTEATTTAIQQGIIRISED